MRHHKRVRGEETRPGPRRFDPIVLGNYECDVWAAYYRHAWVTLLRGSVGMVRVGFGMSRRKTLIGAWFVLRANQAWAPYPANNPDHARDLMRRFYALVAADGGLELDPVKAARLEVEWWRIHRMHQREAALNEDDLVAALVALYSYVYGVEPDAMSEAAALRVDAMRISDEWVEQGCSLDSELLVEERRALVASYTALRRAVAQP